MARLHSKTILRATQSSRKRDTDGFTIRRAVVFVISETSSVLFASGGTSSCCDIARITCNGDYCHYDSFPIPPPFPVKPANMLAEDGNEHIMPPHLSLGIEAAKLETIVEINVRDSGAH